MFQLSIVFDAVCDVLIALMIARPRIRLPTAAGYRVLHSRCLVIFNDHDLDQTDFFVVAIARVEWLNLMCIFERHGGMQWTNNRLICAMYGPKLTIQFIQTHSTKKITQSNNIVNSTSINRWVIVIEHNWFLLHIVIWIRSYEQQSSFIAATLHRTLLLSRNSIEAVVNAAELCECRSVLVHSCTRTFARGHFAAQQEKIEILYLRIESAKRWRPRSSGDKRIGIATALSPLPAFVNVAACWPRPPHTDSHSLSSSSSSSNDADVRGKSWFWYEWAGESRGSVAKRGNM